MLLSLFDIGKSTRPKGFINLNLESYYRAQKSACMDFYFFRMVYYRICAENEKTLKDQESV